MLLIIRKSDFTLVETDFFIFKQGRNLQENDYITCCSNIYKSIACEGEFLIRWKFTFFQLAIRIKSGLNHLWFLLLFLLLSSVEFRFYFMYKCGQAKINTTTKKESRKDCPEIPIGIFFHLKNRKKDNNNTSYKRCEPDK